MSALLHLLDFLREGILVCDSTGVVLHATPALTQALAAEPESERLREEMEALARSLTSAPRGEEGTVEVGVREVTTVKRLYRLRGIRQGEGLCGLGGSVLVALEPLSPEPLPDRVLRDRFGLTRMQIRIARLQAARRSNAEIAAELSLSPHTVRHHTQCVLDKLRVRSRTQVGAAILRRGGMQPEHAEK